MSSTTAPSSPFTMYPCDRGIPMNTAARGFHDFQASEHGVACRLCGAIPPKIGRPEPTT